MINKLPFLYIILLICITSIFSCEQIDKKRHHILDQQEMILVLTDMHMADGMLSQISERDSMLKQSYLVYSEIFKKHHINYAEFKKSMMYYTNHPKELSLMYKEVLDSINKRLPANKTLIK